MPLIVVDEHPLLDARVLETVFPSPLGMIPLRESFTGLLSLECDAPIASSDETRAAVRDLLRHHGFKPTGRSKPASEYLRKAAQSGTLSAINVAVDACNAVSLHSGLPISVIDLDVATKPFHIRLAPDGSDYVFNRSGQTMDVCRLLCLFDADGPCANPVKDSQRTKTSDGTRRTLSIIWGAKALSETTTAAEQWYHALLQSHEASITRIFPTEHTG